MMWIISIIIKMYNNSKNEIYNNNNMYTNTL